MAIDQASTVEFLSQVEFLSALDATELAALAGCAETVCFEFGETIFRQNEHGRGLFVIRSGMVRLFIEENDQEIGLGLRKPGDVLGEVSCLRNIRHGYSAKSAAESELLLIPQDALIRIVQHNGRAMGFMTRHAAIQNTGGFVAQFFELKGKLNKAEIESLIETLGIKRVKAGKTILQQDTCEDRRLYVIRQGAVRLVRCEDNHEYPLARLGKGEIFGEQAALLHHNHLASAQAETHAVLLAIPERTLHTILAYHPHLRTLLEQRIQLYEREIDRQRTLITRRFGKSRAAIQSEGGLRQKLIKRFELVEQAEEMDCGAACLAMICKHHGITASLIQLRELANVDREGASLASLAKAGERLGFAVRGIESTFPSLIDLEPPFIAHWQGYHYIVVYGVSPSAVWVADPAAGFKKMTPAEFERGWTGACLLFEFQRRPDRPTERSSIDPGTAALGKICRPILLPGFIANLVIGILAVSPPVIFQHLLDQAVTEADLLPMLVLGWAVAYGGKSLAAFCKNLLVGLFRQQADFALPSLFIRHILALPLAFFETRRTADILARLEDNGAWRRFLTETLPSIPTDLCLLLISIAVLCAYDVFLAGIFIVTALPMVGLHMLLAPMRSRYQNRYLEAMARADNLLRDFVQGAEALKSLGGERAMRLRWEKQLARAVGIKRQGDRLLSRVHLGEQSLQALALTVLLWLGANKSIQGDWSVGQLVAFLMITGLALSALMDLGKAYHAFVGVSAVLPRHRDLWELSPEQTPTETVSKIVLPELRGSITLQNLCFRYQAGAPSVLEDLTLTIQPGERILVIGPAGSGKSTWAKLLLGLYLPSEGSLCVDGYDLNVLDRPTLRTHMGYVPQRAHLFGDTIAQNIALAAEDLDMKQMVAVCRAVGLDGLIEQLPQHYETFIQSQEHGLSPEQVRRLMLARALYRNPSLLILDELTGNLDHQSAQALLNAVRENMAGKTVLAFSRRPLLQLRPDRIALLLEGRIVEAGSPDELIASKGLYYQMLHADHEDS
jgi:subfamily B ATP-binding cassette protein HlyB/CyaB